MNPFNMWLEDKQEVRKVNENFEQSISPGWLGWVLLVPNMAKDSRRHASFRGRLSKYCRRPDQCI